MVGSLRVIHFLHGWHSILGGVTPTFPATITALPILNHSRRCWMRVERRGEAFVECAREPSVGKVCRQLERNHNR